MNIWLTCLPTLLQKHVCLNCPPPQPEDGDVPDQATAAEDSAHETEPQGSEAPESGKGAESSGDRSDSSRTLSSPLSATSSKSKKRAREDDEEVSSASKHPEPSTKSHSDAGYDFFGDVIGISE